MEPALPLSAPRDGLLLPTSTDLRVKWIADRLELALGVGDQDLCMCEKGDVEAVDKFLGSSCDAGTSLFSFCVEEEVLVEEEYEESYEVEVASDSEIGEVDADSENRPPLNAPLVDAAGEAGRNARFN
jgi:hypothetical protein